ncbi:hypothetical protein [Bosea sp. BIWAKO-01]|uniref:hypothetical protein n=1 Tax=Bosea sp. BIWAKO-01 TaxID=506668 RepID=UPI0008528FC3|nr:hypothetical protein [Bosea sp. BIWAKO-01]GAU81359.1 hypothetical protein BIWAKO_01252 [Bosea sp. BIWAKO-01]
MIRMSRRPRQKASHALRCLALATLLTLAPFAASRAGEAAVALDPPRLAQAPEPLCFCWSDGRKIAEGLTACIKTTQGRRLAECGRVINMMSWRVTDNPCPES